MMELIPVFSLIVLVATISTFILAVGAYVMFRVRESKAKGPKARPAASYEAEVFAPEPIDFPEPDGGLNNRRELLRDPRVKQFQPDVPGRGEGSQQDDRRRWR